GLRSDVSELQESLGISQRVVRYRRHGHEVGMLTYEQRQLVQVARDGTPPTPIGTDDLTKTRPIDLRAPFAWAVSGSREGRKQLKHVPDGLLIDLDDLQFGEEEVDHVQCEGKALEVRPEVELVAHRQSIDHDVDRTPGRGVEVHLAVAVQGVEPAV